LFKKLFDLLNEFSKKNFSCYSSSVLTAFGEFSSTQAKNAEKCNKCAFNSKNLEKCQKFNKKQKIQKNSNLPAK
jgi:hypothetical protein